MPASRSRTARRSKRLDTRPYRRHPRSKTAIGHGSELEPDASRSGTGDPMLLAEALAAKKDALTELADLRGRLAAAAVRYEDQDAPTEYPDVLLARMATTLDQIEDLSVRINRTNNEARVAFDGRDLTIMEAVALRDRLTLEAKARRGMVEAIDEALETGINSKVNPYQAYKAQRRSKDDVRRIATVDVRAARAAANDLSERVRRLDIALQQRNWTTDLVE